jgi:DNA-binding MarR family transcriptional regulator
MHDVAIDRLIHEPARLRLMTLLYVVDEADFVYIADRSGMTAGNISSHMAKLEAAGYVEIEKLFVERKPRTLYRLTDDGRVALDSYGDAIKDMLASLE